MRGRVGCRSWPHYYPTVSVIKRLWASVCFVVVVVYFFVWCFVFFFLSIEWRQQTLYSKVIVRRTRCAHKWDSGSLMIITKHL